MKAKTRKIVGVLFIILPIVGFLTVMLLWPLIAGLIVSFASTETVIGLTPVVTIINVALGVLGLVSIVMIPVGLVVGIILLVKKDEVRENVEVDSTVLSSDAAESDTEEIDNPQG